jgi:non-heme chloroperoxidase
MSKVLIGVLALLFVIAMIPVTVIALSSPSSPPAMTSMAGPLNRVNFEDVPTPQRLQARDGARPQYYAYPAAQNKVAALVHGSVGPGTGMHALAKALRDAGVSTYALDIRGHGGSGRRGDIDYIGQIDDDLDDFVTSLGPARPDQVRTLVGFSAGAGFTIRFAGGRYGELFDRYVFLSPILPGAPTLRPNAGWTNISIPRVVTMLMVDRWLPHRTSAACSGAGAPLKPQQWKLSSPAQCYGRSTLSSGNAVCAQAVTLGAIN